MARQFLGQEVRVVIDRPVGATHRDAGFTYELNYGYIPGVIAPDGEELDAYVIGPAGPVDSAVGTCIAIVHRLYEDDDKLIVATDGRSHTDDEILTAVCFQEGSRPHVIVRH